MTTCASCKHWGGERVGDGWEDSPPFGTCQAIPDNEKDGLAYTYDYEGYMSGIRTRAEFGCLLHEAKS